MWYVYILLCTDGSLYTGSTNNPDQRFNEHKNGKGGRYTRSHPPLKRVYLKAYETKSEALKEEYAIKQLTRAQKISSLGITLI